MRGLTLLGALLSITCAWAQTSTIDAYVASESAVARSGVFANIGPSGSQSTGAVSPCLLAP